MKQNISKQGSPFVQLGVLSGGPAEAMRSQQAQGSQQAEVTAGSEVTEVPEPRGCTAAQGASTQSLSTAVAAAAAVAAALLTLGQRCQDSGGSKSCGTGRGRGTMGLALRLFLLLLLAVALPARAAQAAPLRVRGADWDHKMAYMEKLVKDSMKSLGHGGGPPRWMNQDTGDKKSLEAAKHLDQMLSDLERRRAMQQKSMQMGPYPIGSNGFVPAPAAAKEEMPDMDTGTGEALGKSGTNAQNPRNTPRLFCPQDVRRSCMIGTVVTLFTVPIAMVLCYVGFRWWKGKKRRAAAAPASRPRRRASPSPPGSPETFGFDSSHTRPRQQQLPKKAEPQPSVPPPRPPSPAVKRKPSEIPPPPPLPSPPPWSS